MVHLELKRIEMFLGQNYSILKKKGVSKQVIQMRIIGNDCTLELELIEKTCLYSPLQVKPVVFPKMID